MRNRTTKFSGQTAAHLILAVLCLGLGVSMAQEPQPSSGSSKEPLPSKSATGPAESNPAAFPNPPPPEDEHPAVLRLTAQGDIEEFHVYDADLYSALLMLRFESKQNMIFGPETQGKKITVSLYKMSLDKALHYILDPQGFAYRKKDGVIEIYTKEHLKQIIESEQPILTRSLRLNYISPEDAIKLLEPFKSDKGTIVSGSGKAGTASTGGAMGSSQSSAIEDLLVVKDYEENIKEIEKQLAVLDQRPKQVLVEATILRATLNESNAMGIDFNLLGGVDFEKLTVANHITSPLRLGPNVAVSAGTTGSTGTSTTGTGTTTGSDYNRLANTVPLSKVDDITVSTQTNFANAVPSGGLTLGITSNDINVFIRALEAVTDVAVLANPKVLVVNKQECNFLVGGRDGYRGVSTATVTSTTESVEFLETGTQLKFRPFISSDGYVRMTVNPSDSTGGINALGLPFQRTTETTTDILVKDGHTILIGGLFRDTSTTGRSQIPLLGSIPLIGAAFGSNADSTIREEVIILLTVRIIEDQDAYAAHSAEVLDDMERLRVGVRESMMPFGRERLAQVNYHKALEYAAKGWDGLALWHNKLAIHNRPSFVDAIKLREELLQKREVDYEGSLIRNFLHEKILEEQGQKNGKTHAPESPTDEGTPAMQDIKPDDKEIAE